MTPEELEKALDSILHRIECLACELDELLATMYTLTTTTTTTSP